MSAARRIAHVILSILAVIIFASLFLKSLRGVIVSLVATFLDPLLVLPIYLLILLLATFTAIYSSLIQKATIDMKKFKEFQKIIAEFQKEYFEALKQDNKFKLKKLEAEKPKIDKLRSEVMSATLKNSVYTIIVTIPIFLWIIAKVYDVSLQDKMLVKAPFLGKIHASDPVLFIPWWIIWYIVCSVFTAQIVKKALKIS